MVLEPSLSVAWGSSPLTRGTLFRHISGARHRGIIPAYAGNTLASALSAAKRWDHPRLRGEHSSFLSHCCSGLGSSPLTRGTRTKHDRGTLRHGIIPAYAGNTRCAPSSAPPTRDHPRLRGEHMGTCSGLSLQSGSSPLTRGTLLPFGVADFRLGIIPAYAGNTSSPGMSRTETRDHPRLRGEHIVDIYESTVAEGSSPLTRGTLADVAGCDVVIGIIPAYAGNTDRAQRYERETRDHPRLRGEHRSDEA